MSQPNPNPNPAQRGTIRITAELFAGAYATILDLERAQDETMLEINGAVLRACPGLVIRDQRPGDCRRDTDNAGREDAEAKLIAEILLEVEAPDLNAARVALSDYADLLYPEDYELGLVHFELMPDTARTIREESARLAHELEAVEDALRGAAEAYAQAGGRMTWIAADMSSGATMGEIAEALGKAATVAEHAGILIQGAQQLAGKIRGAQGVPATAPAAVRFADLRATATAYALEVEISSAAASMEISGMRTAAELAGPETAAGACAPDGAAEAPCAREACAASHRAHRSARAALEAAGEIRALRLILRGDAYGKI